MTPFKFPPPPPPPPKAPSNDAQNPYSSQRGGLHTARGDRHRGRGFVGRARGNNQGSSRGAYGLGGGSGDVRGREGSRGSYQQRGRGGLPNQAFTQGQRQQQYQQPPQQGTSPPNTRPFPNGTPGNPLFGAPLPVGGQALPVDPAAFAQAMAFMSTPAGMQTMTAFANHIAGNNVTPQSPLSPPSQQLPPQLYQSPSESGSVRKRKRNERAINYQSQQNPVTVQNPQPRGQKPPRAKAAAPPAVPGFGFSLPPVPPPQPSDTPKLGSKHDQKKRKVILGLTHREEDLESSAEEDIDEEAVFVSNVKVEGGVVFEHEGESISLQTPAEIAAWIKDRRKQFPTRKRIAEKAQEAAAKRASELEFLRKIKGGANKKRVEVQRTRTTTKDMKVFSETRRSDLEELRKNARESVKESVSLEQKKSQTPIGARKPKCIDLGLGYDSETVSEEDESSELEDSSVVSSSEDADADSDRESDDSDAPPVQHSSTRAPTPITVPPPPLTQVVKEPEAERPDICFRWKQFGKCKYGSHCRYSHPQKEEPKRMGLYEKMVEQELEKADRLALDAIKYLGRHGFLG